MAIALSLLQGTHTHRDRKGLAVAGHARADNAHDPRRVAFGGKIGLIGGKDDRAGDFDGVDRVIGVHGGSPCGTGLTS
jgi:hypothetical protein